VLKFSEMLPMGNRRNRALFAAKKEISAASQTVAATKICPKQCAHSEPDFIQSVHFRPSYSRMREHRFFAP